VPETSRRDFLISALLLAPAAGAAEGVAVAEDFDRIASMAKRCRLPLPPGVEKSTWTDWVRNHDREIRARLRRGEHDSLVNFVLYGVSFTDRPRVRLDTPDQSLIDARIRDFLVAVNSPGENERIAFLRTLLPGESDAGWVRENIARYLAEQRQYSNILDRSTANEPVSSTLYKQRGLSVDTNFRPNFAIETALADLKRRGVLKLVRRAAVIGPGLDFTDKDNGLDYYPLQTIQPFALIDSLLRLGLASLPDLQISVFDISSQTLDHLSQAQNQPYTVQLVLDRSRPWTKEALGYWRRFGDRIGAPVEPMAAPKQITNVERRAVRIRPDVVRALQPAELNIVLQRPASDKYDLIVGTNLFVYYDAFEQALAMLNIGATLTPGGILLANTVMPDCQAEGLHLIGRSEVQYSRQSGDDDQVEIYSNAALRRSLAPQ
jgi:hypothetical protein